MRKVDMNEAQLASRNFILEMMKATGWTGTAAHLLFDRGDDVKFEAFMEYENQTMDLFLSYQASSNQLCLGIYEREGRGLDFIFEASSQLENALKTLVAVQDTISKDNYKELLRKLLKICPDMKVILSEDSEPVPVYDSIALN